MRAAWWCALSCRRIEHIQIIIFVIFSIPFAFTASNRALWAQRARHHYDYVVNKSPKKWPVSYCLEVASIWFSTDVRWLVKSIRANVMVQRTALIHFTILHVSIETNGRLTSIVTTILFSEQMAVSDAQKRNCNWHDLHPLMTREIVSGCADAKFVI